MVGDVAVAGGAVTPVRAFFIGPTAPIDGRPHNHLVCGAFRPLPRAVIRLASEADMLIFHPTVLGFGKGAFFTRNLSDSDWRQYEMAAMWIGIGRWALIAAAEHEPLPEELRCQK